MAKLGKRLSKAYSAIDQEKAYPLAEAVALLKDLSTCKFDETVEVTLRLNVDTRKADQNVRGVVMMPHGTGKVVRVAVMARGPKADEAKAAGADIVGAEDLVEKIQGGEIAFDVCIATPDMMGIVGRVAKILGPKGLMPNPKLGTVTLDVTAAVQAAKSGQVEYRADKTGIVHAGTGKVSFTIEAVEENIKALVGAVMRARPAGIKGVFLKRAFLTTTMGPSIRLELGQLTSL